MVSWAKFALALIQMLSSLFTWFRGEQLKDEGRSEVQGKINTEALDVLQRATKAREDARSRNDAIPESDSLPDDGFRRD